MSGRTPSGHSGLLLLHGNLAHAHWWVTPDQMCMDTMQTPLLLERRWAHLAPFWIDQFDVVVSMTTSGFGASGWRAKYSFEIWAEEAVGVAQHVGMEPKASNKNRNPKYGSFTAIVTDISKINLNATQPEN